MMVLDQAYLDHYVIVDAEGLVVHDQHGDLKGKDFSKREDILHNRRTLEPYVYEIVSKVDQSHLLAISYPLVIEGVYHYTVSVGLDQAFFYTLY